MKIYSSIKDVREDARTTLITRGHEIPAGHWQGTDAMSKEIMLEFINYNFTVRIPNSLTQLEAECEPDLPWADVHFRERISGMPLNPGESYKIWPYNKFKDGNDPYLVKGEYPSIDKKRWVYYGAIIDGEGTVSIKVDEGTGREGFRIIIGQKDESFLIKLQDDFAGAGTIRKSERKRIKVRTPGTKKHPNGREYDQVIYTWTISRRAELEWVIPNVIPFVRVEEKKKKLEHMLKYFEKRPINGNTKPFELGLDEPKFSHSYMERYWGKDSDNGYGDLNDIINLLKTDIHTRQAILPVWWPVDNGNIKGVRVPCSLMYHFFYRGYGLHCNYYIRSCDYYRHFKNDIYLTARLAQHIMKEVCRSKNSIEYNMGYLSMYITHFHLFKNDIYLINKQNGKDNKG